MTQKPNATVLIIAQQRADKAKRLVEDAQEHLEKMRTRHPGINQYTDAAEKHLHAITRDYWKIKSNERMIAAEQWQQWKQWFEENYPEEKDN